MTQARPAQVWSRSGAVYSIGAALAAAVPVATAVALAHLLWVESLPGAAPAALASALMVGVAAALVQSRIAAERERSRQAVEMQMPEIAQANQRIQRALDTVRSSPHSAFDQQVVASISQQASRTELATSSVRALMGDGACGAAVPSQARIGLAAAAQRRQSPSL